MALARYEGTTVDESGNVLPGMSIDVRREDNLPALALLYSDRAGTIPQANGLAFVSGSDGGFGFHALGGAYRIRVYGNVGGVPFEEIRRYVAIGTAAETDLSQGLSGGMLLTFDDGVTDADPGTGALRFNNATPASVTFLYVDLTNTYGDDITAWLGALDDSGSPTDKGRLRIQVDGNPAVWFEFIVTGAVVTATGYRKVPVTLVASAGTVADGDALALFFSAAGPGTAATVSYAGGPGFVSTTVEGALDEAGAKLQHITVTQSVDLDAIETRVNALDAAVVLKGTWDASAGTFPGGGTAQAGESWIVSVAGTVNSVEFAVNDRIIAITDNASTSTFAANWFKADYTDLINSTTVGAAIFASTAKTTPVDADTIGITDSAASNILKKVTWANIKATLKTYFDTLYQPLDADLTAIAALTTTTYGRSLLTLADLPALKTVIGNFSSSLAGLTPASGGGTSNFLRADGSWAEPPGGGGGGSIDIMTYLEAV